MATFPTLTTPERYAIPDAMIADSRIMTPFEAGFVQVRQRFNWIPKRWRVAYERMVNTDKCLLRIFEFETTNGGADAFTWIHPWTGVTYTVRFAGPISYTTVGYECTGTANGPFAANYAPLWNVTFELEQVQA